MVGQVNEEARVRLSEADICMNLKKVNFTSQELIAVRGNGNEEQSGVQRGSRGRGTRPRGHRC